MNRMPGPGDYERFPSENVSGDPRDDDPHCGDYEKSPCRRENCSSYDPQEESGCKQYGRHFVSMCLDYTKVSRDEEMEQLRADLYHAKKENEKLRRIVHAWAENWHEQMGFNEQKQTTWRMQ